MPASENAKPPPEIYRALLENLHQALFLKNRDGVFLYVNERFGQLINREPAEIVGKTDHDLFPQELADKYRRDDLLVINEPGQTHLKKCAKMTLVLLGNVYR